MTIVVIQSFSHSTNTTNYHMLYMSRPPVGSGETLMIKNPQNVLYPTGLLLSCFRIWGTRCDEIPGFCLSESEDEASVSRIK